MKRGVIATYQKVRLIPQISRVLHLDVFDQPEKKLLFQQPAGDSSACLSRENLENPGSLTILHCFPDSLSR
jgi:hypothetical protein